MLPTDCLPHVSTESTRSAHSTRRLKERSAQHGDRSGGGDNGARSQSLECVELDRTSILRIGPRTLYRDERGHQGGNHCCRARGRSLWFEEGERVARRRDARRCRGNSDVVEHDAEGCAATSEFCKAVSCVSRWAARRPASLREEERHSTVEVGLAGGEPQERRARAVRQLMQTPSAP